MKPKRNDPCPCGSGKKYKHCHEGITPWYKQSTWTGVLIILFILGAAYLVWSSMSDPGDNPDTQGKVWSPEHGHYH